MSVRSAIDTFAVSSDEIIRDVSKLYIAKPNEYALISLLHTRGMEYEKTPEGVNVNGSPLNTEIVYNPKFEQQVDELESDETTVNYAAGYAAGATSIVLTDGTLVPKFSMLYVPRTGELMRVSSMSANTATVTRAEGGTTAAAIVHGDTIIIQGSAYAENALSGDARFKQTAFTYNYTQIDREQYGESRTSDGTRYYNNAQSFEKNKAIALHGMLRRFNGTLWLGGRSIDTSGKVRTMGGVLEFIDSGNVMDVNQNLTRADFDYWTRTMAFAYNSNRKTLFAGSRLLDKIDGWADEKSWIKEENTLNQFGMAVRTYRTRYGILDLVWEPYFDKMTVGTLPLNTYGVCLDLELISFKYLSNGILQDRDNIQENDRDGRKGEWLMEGGICVNVQKAHSIIRGV
jgi:hypothetical protein